MKPIMTPEGIIVREVLLALTEQCGHLCVAWRANSGAAQLPGKGGAMRLVRFGAPGQADISGLLTGSGRRLEIECKTEVGRQRPDQIAFQAIVERAGGVYLLVRSAEQAVAGVRAAAEEARR